MLMGPSGIGALLLDPAFARELTPIVTGGTGSASDSEIQPAYMPDRFESGTPNLPGIYGLQAAVDFILDTGVEVLHRREMELTGQFLEGIRDVPGIRLAGPRELENRAGVISVDFLAADNAEAAFRLEQAHLGVWHPHPVRTPLRPLRPQDPGHLPPGDRPLQPRMVHHPGGDPRRRGRGTGDRPGMTPAAGRRRRILSIPEKMAAQLFRHAEAPGTSSLALLVSFD